MSVKLSDLSWLGDGVSATTPWQPDEVAVKISRYDPTRKVQAFDETVQRWPLDGTVADLVGSRCLTGDDARKVFALMKHGVTNVRIRVDDGSGIPWQIGVEPVVPGQPDLGGACS